MPDKSHLRRECPVCLTVPGETVHPAGEGRGSPLHPVRKQKVGNTGGGLHFIQFRTPAQAIDMVVSPSSIKSLCKLPYRHVQTCVPWVIPNLVKLTVNVNYHIESHCGCFLGVFSYPKACSSFWSPGLFLHSVLCCCFSSTCGLSFVAPGVPECP